MYFSLQIIKYMYFLKRVKYIKYIFHGDEWSLESWNHCCRLQPGSLQVYWVISTNCQIEHNETKGEVLKLLNLLYAESAIAQLSNTLPCY